MSKLIIGGREFNSRLFVGTGKFSSNDLIWFMGFNYGHLCTYLSFLVIHCFITCLGNDLNLNTL